MLRWLLNLAAALSLLVCLAICAIWVRSFYRTDQRTWLTPTAFYEVMSGGGGVVLYRLRPPDGEVRWVRPAVTRSVVGAEVIEGRLARRRPWKMLLLPYWLPAGVAAILPAAWIAARAYRERQASRIQRCPVCGELLTETEAAATTAAAAAAACPSCRWAPSPADLVGHAPRSTPPPAAAATPAAPPADARNPRPVAYRRAI